MNSKTIKKFPRLSFWEKESFLHKIDIAIIGSGIVGLSAAIQLKELNASLQIAIFEKGILPSGASTKNAGFACFGSISELISDLENHSEDEMLKLVAKRWQGLQRLKQRIGASNMDFWECGGYEIFKTTEEEKYQNYLQKIAYLNTTLESIIGRKDIYQGDDASISKFGFQDVQHIIVNQAEGQIHTGKMMQGLLGLAQTMGIKIFNGITVETIQSNNSTVIITTKQQWKITVGKVLVCTNGFTQKILPTLKVLPARNQVLITKPIPNLKVKGTFHYDSGYIYFRNVGNRILLGGARNYDIEGETTLEFGTTNTIQQALMDILSTIILPNEKHFDSIIDYWWSGIMGVHHQKKPVVEMIDSNVGVAVRLGGMGIAIGSLVGEEGARMLLSS